MIALVAVAAVGGSSQRASLVAQAVITTSDTNLAVAHQVMEEVMAKSKKYKADKQHQREEDLNETEALDNKFKALMEGRLMAGTVSLSG